MKILLFVLLLAASVSTFAQQNPENFETLMKEYNSSRLPTWEELTSSEWMLVGMARNQALELNNEHVDYFDSNGVKNRDGSQMTWEFVGYDFNIPQYKYTLTKRNFLKDKQDVLLNSVKFLADSIVYGFSGFPDGKSDDIYYLQHCRLSGETRMICPLTLKLSEKGALKYPFPKLLAARNQTTIVQSFVKK